MPFPVQFPMSMISPCFPQVLYSWRIPWTWYYLVSPVRCLRIYQSIYLFWSVPTSALVQRVIPGCRCLRVFLSVLPCSSR